MHKIGQLITRGKKLFLDDSLFRNSVFLILSTAIMSVLGFGFWLFVAHLYSPDQIGSASALISVTTLLGNISLLGLESSLVRFLPNSKNQSRDINTAMLVVTVASIAASLIYLLIAPLLGVHITLLDDPWDKLGFVALMVVVTLNSLTDAVFIANRRAELHTMTYTMLATVKLILPIFLVPFGSMGIFTAYSVAMVSSLALTFVLMRRSIKYSPTSPPNWSLLRLTRAYSTNNYLGHILASMTSQVMPLLILARLGSDKVAYFSMAWTMANFLYVIPTAIAQSLLAESSGKPSDKGAHIRGAIKLIALVVVPVVAISMVAAPVMLQIFGAKYSAESTGIFQILALATFFVAINEVCNTVLNIEHRSSGVVAAQLSGLAMTFLSATVFLRFGLVGVGISLLLGNIASSICHLIFFGFGLGKRDRHKNGSSEDLAGQANTDKTTSAYTELKTLLAPYGITNFTAKALTGGSSTRTFLIRWNKHAKVLRIYSDKSKMRHHVQQEVDFMRYLTARGVPVPQIIPNTAGDYVTTSDEPHPQHYILMDFEAGSHPTTYTPELIRHMAKNQAAIHIHGIAFAKTQKHRFSLNPKSDLLLRLAPSGFSHCDYDATNILAQNDQLTCILDFEGMRFVPLVSCLYFTLSHLYDAEQVNESVRQYLDAYQQVRQLSLMERWIIRAAMALHCRQPRLLIAGL